MNNYFYVEVANILNDYNEFKKIASNIMLNSDASGLILLNVKINRDDLKYINGRIVTDYGYPAYVICEDKGEYFEEVITGKKFNKIKKNKSNRTDELLISATYKISSDKVIELLKDYNDEEIKRFHSKIEELENFIKKDYQNYFIKEHDEMIQHQKDEEYIKQFKKKYNKKEDN